MSYSHFTAEMKKGMPHPAYVLVSSDPFLHSEALSMIRELVPDAERDFNFQVFDLQDAGSSPPLEQILDVLNTVPFFSGTRFAVIENFQKLPKRDLAKLGRYLGHPSGSSKLILMNAGSLKKEYKESLTGVRQIVLDISEADIPSWIRAKAASRGIEMSPEAAEYLIGMVGTDLGLLSSEVEKCGLLGNPKIGKDDLTAIVEGKRIYNVFALVDAIRERNAEKTFRIYRVLRDTEEPYALLGALNWQFGKAFAGKDLPAEKSYFLRVFGLLNRADIDMKSSGASPLELLLVRLLRLSRGR